MPAGFEVYDEKGQLQFNNELLLYFLRKTGTVTVGNTGGSNSRYVYVPEAQAYKNALVGFSGPIDYGIGLFLNGAINFEYVTDAPVGTVYKYYIFETSDKITTDINTGIQVFNSSGQITFSSTYRVMRSLAVLHTANNDTATFNGKTLGVVPTSWCGYNTYGPPQSEEPGYYYQDFSVCAGAIVNNGNTAETRIIEVPGGRGDVFGPMPTSTLSAAGKFLVIDVTGIPIGSTFF